MFSFTDAIELESGETALEQTALILQRAINSGQGWHLQGIYGRSMMAAIEAGECMLGENEARDAYGNRLPSRHQVKAGARGSRGYVVERKGEDWAAMLDGADGPVPSASKFRP